MEVFVDESGDLGRKGRFFVIALLHPHNKKRILNIARHFNAKLGRDEIKASRLAFSDKQELLARINQFPDHSVSYIAADKHYINSPHMLRDKNLCFNYLFAHLMRPVIAQSDEDINIILDEHSVKVGSLHSLKDYLRIKACYDWGFRGQVNVVFTDSRNSKLVQMADVIANTVYNRYVYDRMNLYEMLNVAHSIRFPHAWFGM